MEKKGPEMSIVVCLGESKSRLILRSYIAFIVAKMYWPGTSQLKSTIATQTTHKRGQEYKRDQKRMSRRSQAPFADTVMPP